MAYISMIIGLPGSGKSHLINELKKGDGWKEYIVIDDPPYNSNFIELYGTLLEQKKSLIVADPLLCNPDIRKKAEEMFRSFGYKVQYYFFENDQEKCWNNIKHRNDNRKIYDLNYFKYTIPPNELILKIWQPDVDKISN